MLTTIRKILRPHVRTNGEIAFANSDVRCFLQPDLINIWKAEEAVVKVDIMLRENLGFTFFTLNLDHMCKLSAYPSFRLLYLKADFIAADGWPVAFFAKRAGAPVFQVKGSELIEPMCSLAMNNDCSIFLFGTTSHALKSAASVLTKRYPRLKIAGKISPPRQFDARSQLAADFAETISASGARLCFVALGAPTQESFADFARDRCPSVGFFCIGAGLDFLAGTQHRAPLILRRLRMEWAWRWASAPVRLTPRYIDSLKMFLWLLSSGA